MDYLWHSVQSGVLKDSFKQLNMKSGLDQGTVLHFDWRTQRLACGLGTTNVRLVSEKSARERDNLSALEALNQHFPRGQTKQAAEETKTMLKCDTTEAEHRWMYAERRGLKEARILGKRSVTFAGHTPVWEQERSSSLSWISCETQCFALAHIPLLSLFCRLLFRPTYIRHCAAPRSHFLPNSPVPLFRDLIPIHPISLLPFILNLLLHTPPFTFSSHIMSHPLQIFRHCSPFWVRPAEPHALLVCLFAGEWRRCVFLPPAC